MKTIRTLVGPTNSTQNLVACQRTVSQCGKNNQRKVFTFDYFIQGLLHRLCVMLTLTTIPADVLAEVSYTCLVSLSLIFI